MAGRKPLRSVEDQHVEVVIAYADATALPPIEGERLPPGCKVGDYLFHVPNGGARSRTEAGIMTRLGVRAGVPDLWLPVPRRGFTALVIEAKKPVCTFASEREAARHLQPNQHRWLAKLNRVNVLAVAAYGSRAMLDWLCWYAGTRHPDTREVPSNPPGSIVDLAGGMVPGVIRG